MTPISQPDFVGRLLSRGAGDALVVRPLLPSLFEPAPPPVEAAGETLVRHRLKAVAEPERSPAPVRETGSGPKAVEQVAEPAPGAPVLEPSTKSHPAPAPVPRLRSAPPPEPRTAARPRPQAGPQPEPTEKPRVKPALIPANTVTQPVPVERRAETPVRPVPEVVQERDRIEPVAKGTQQQGVPAIGQLAPVAQPVRSVLPRRSRATEQTVHITIGRVEVKAGVDKTPERRAPARRQPAVSLEDYLRRRGGGTS